MVKARRSKHLEGFRDAPGHLVRAVGVRPHGDQLPAALPEPAQEGGPAVQIVAPAGVELNGAAAGCHLGEDGPDLFLKIRQGQIHPVAVDVPQGIDDVGQTVIAIGAFLHQRPGVG